MQNIEMFLSTVDRIINTKRRRHTIGGVLLSVSILFGGLAFTVMTIKNEEENHEKRLLE